LNIGKGKSLRLKMRQNMAAGTVQNDLYHGIYKTLPVIARFGALFPPIARKNGVIL